MEAASPPEVVREGDKLVCRRCSLYHPTIYGYATSADPATSGPEQMQEHLARHAGEERKEEGDAATTD